jgi:hypothetical protein
VGADLEHPLQPFGFIPLEPVPDRFPSHSQKPGDLPLALGLSRSDQIQGLQPLFLTPPALFLKSVSQIFFAFLYFR